MDRSKSAKKLFPTDIVAEMLQSGLLEDFRSSLPPDLYLSLQSSTGRNKVGEWREKTPRPDYEDKPYPFKGKAQLHNLFKKYTFEKDVYSPAEITSMSVEKFLDNQRRLSSFAIDDSSIVTKSVIMYAKGWIEGVLKDFDNEEFLGLCRFARKSTVGIPMADASLSERWSVPLTGSKDHISWFRDEYLSWNRHPVEYIRAQVGGDLNVAFREVESLEAVLVPKTFKSRRMIMANTTIGSLYSNGSGKLITARLASAGYDISSLQKEHGDLAKIGSARRTLVTADQSLASDNLTCELIDRLLPGRWARALSRGRIGRIRSPYFPEIETKIFSTMGIGFTFPLQTLVFLGLLKGISLEFFKKNLRVSAYGDDLVYDHRLHPFVTVLFPKFGLIINADKTYSEGGFRESCGSDFFHGVDVRPFQLGEVDSNFLSRRKYEAFLYTAINGLRRRWLDEEIPVTLRLLGSHMHSIGIKPYIVPNDFPDTAGVKSLHPYTHHEFLMDCREPKGRQNGLIKFKYLRFIADRRTEDRHEPYLWNALQQLSADTGHCTEHRNGSVGAIAYLRSLRVCEDTFYEEVSERQPANYRSKLTGKRLRKRDTLIPILGRGRYREQLGSSSHWA